MQETKCAICRNRMAISNGILCEICADRYSKLVRIQFEKTREFNARISQGAQSPSAMRTEDGVSDSQPADEALLESIQMMPEKERETRQTLSGSQVLRGQKRTTTLVGFFLLAVGMIAVIAAVVFVSTISVFIGLGLTFWGLLAFFIQPNKYVKVEEDLMNATTLSSLRTIDKMLVGMGYREKGVYVLAGDSDRAVIFVPSEPFSKIPEVSNVGDRVFISNPEGLLVPPPGLALASLIEKKLGFKLKNCGIEQLVEGLPRVLVEDLEIVKDVEIAVTGDSVSFKVFESIYSDFCFEMRDVSRRCGLGCPLCSALACILVLATGKPVVYAEDRTFEEQQMTELVCQLISGRRL